MATTPQLKAKHFSSGQFGAIIKAVHAKATGRSGDPNRNPMETPKVTTVCTLLALTATASAGSVNADPLAALRADHST